MVFLVAFVFQALSNPDPKGKKSMMMRTGILGLLMLIGGFGLVARMKTGFPWWVTVKLICWFGLMGITGMAYRMPERLPLLRMVAAILVVTAIATVYLRPLGFE